MQFLQIIQCGLGGGGHIATTVIPVILLQAVVFAGGRNELPDTGGFGVRIGLRIEGAFNHGQQGDFHRHAARFDFINNMKQVAA